MELEVGTHLIATRDVRYSKFNDRILKFTKGNVYVVTKVLRTPTLNLVTGFRVVNNYGMETNIMVHIMGHISSPECEEFEECPKSVLRAMKINKIFG